MFERKLEDAGDWLAGQLRRSGKDPDTQDELTLSLLRQLSCSLVERSIGDYDPTRDEPQWHTVTGPNFQAYTPTCEHRPFWLREDERLMLGIGGGRCAFAGEVE